MGKILSNFDLKQNDFDLYNNKKIMEKMSQLCQISKKEKSKSSDFYNKFQ
jgi:hypothetical protein